ncbi:MAG: type II restriction endonuclease, partial [Bacteroidetes bacterium]
EKIKNDFETEVAQNDKRFLKLNKLKGDLLSLTNQGSLFDKSKKEKEIWNKNVSKISEEIKNLEDQITGIKNNKIYKDAFEWRFEFPEILNYDGDFVGFDLIIGNPPYIPLEDYSINERAYFGNTFEILERKYDSSVMFFINGLSLLNNSGLLSYIAPITWQTGENYSSFRKWIFTFKGIEQIINLPFNIFEDAYVETAIYFLTNFNNSTFKIYRFNKKEKEIDLKSINFTVIPGDLILPNKFKIILNPLVNKLLKRLNPEKYIQLGMITISTQGLSGSIFKETNIEDEDTFIFLSKGNVYNYWISEDETFITSLKKHKSLKQFYDSDDKILIRRLINRQDRLSVCYTNKRMIYKKDINPFIPTDKDFPAKYLLAVMASKLISFLYINISSIATKDDFRQTTLTELRELPIPLINSDMHSNIIKTVDKILHIKKLNPESDTSSLESKIDLIVYDLYGLTKEEIKIVENSI